MTSEYATPPASAHDFTELLGSMGSALVAWGGIIGVFTCLNHGALDIVGVYLSIGTWCVGVGCQILATMRLSREIDHLY